MVKHCCSIKVFGKVQGVFFRMSAKKMAESLGLKGDVRNMNDGSVFIRVCGDAESLDSLQDWCRTGPPSAIVERVERKAENSMPDFVSFEIAY